MGERDDVSDLETPGAVNLNKAAIDDLLGLPAVTAERAQAILDHRPFAAWEDVAAALGSDVAEDMRKGGAILV